MKFVKILIVLASITMAFTAFQNCAEISSLNLAPNELYSVVPEGVPILCPDNAGEIAGQHSSIEALIDAANASASFDSCLSVNNNKVIDLIGYGPCIECKTIAVVPEPPTSQPTPPPQILPPVTSDCSQKPSHVLFKPAIDWSKVSRIPQDFSTILQNETAAYPTTTGPESFREGQVAIASGPGEPTVLRRMWFSYCPGAEPTGDLNHPACDKSGAALTVINWEHNTNPRWNRCTLPNNRKVYLNINANCPTSRCSYFLNHY